jgi:hypothetical protein
MKTLDTSAKGVYLIAVTPFMENGALDLASTDRMVDFYLERGATGLTILGIMGEAPKLTAEESRIFVKRVLARVNNKVPVIVGASAPGFAPMRELTESVMDLGASGVMVAPPSTVRTDDQIVAYFDMVNETLGAQVPWCLQDHPVATGVQMSTSVILRILKNSPTCATSRSNCSSKAPIRYGPRHNKPPSESKKKSACGPGSSTKPKSLLINWQLRRHACAAPFSGVISAVRGSCTCSAGFDAGKEQNECLPA